MLESIFIWYRDANKRRLFSVNEKCNAKTMIPTNCKSYLLKLIFYPKHLYTHNLKIKYFFKNLKKKKKKKKKKKSLFCVLYSAGLISIAWFWMLLIAPERIIQMPSH